jgi:hypothetical protein
MSVTRDVHISIARDPKQPGNISFNFKFRTWTSSNQVTQYGKRATYDHRSLLLLTIPPTTTTIETPLFTMSLDDDEVVVVDESTGVRQRVIDDLKKWRDWLLPDDDEQPQQGERFELFLEQEDSPCKISPRDVEYMVLCLRVILPLQAAAAASTKEDAQTKTTRK